MIKSGVMGLYNYVMKLWLYVVIRVVTYITFGELWCVRAWFITMGLLCVG